MHHHVQHFSVHFPPCLFWQEQLKLGKSGSVVEWISHINTLCSSSFTITRLPSHNIIITSSIVYHWVEFSQVVFLTHCVFWVSDHMRQIKPSSRALGTQYIIFIPCTFGNLAILGFDSWSAASPSGELIAFKQGLNSCRECIIYVSELNAIHTCRINYLL